MEVMVAILIFLSLIVLVWFLSRRVQGRDDVYFMHSIVKAAEAGDPIAQFKLANLYYEGKGLPRDDEEAARWYIMAAQQDHIEAQYFLGVMYEKGSGVPRDDDQAYKWFSMAARQGFARARSVLESEKWMSYQQVKSPQAEEHVRSAENEDGVTAEQIQDFSRRAFEGDVDAQYNLGIIYYHGEGGVPRNFEQAVAWFHKAAEQADADAQYNLGFMYGRGEGVAKDHNQSVAWFKKAAEQGHAGAQEILDKMIKKA